MQFGQKWWREDVHLSREDNLFESSIAKPALLPNQSFKKKY